MIEKMRIFKTNSLSQTNFVFRKKLHKNHRQFSKNWILLKTLMPFAIFKCI